MEVLQRSIFFLSAYWLIFWRDFLRNPWKLSTSEIASTQFPQWVWQGRQWRKGEVPTRDNIFYFYPGCVPFLSTFYPWTVISSYLGSFLSLDSAFRVFSYGILVHYLLASFIAYFLFSSFVGPIAALFGAITLVYSGYVIKPQTPSFVYTMCWMPGMLIGGWFGAISCCMAVLGGYWPILVYFFPVAVILNPFCLLGLVPAMIQILPFLWYLPKSIRATKKYDPKQGRIPWHKLKDLVMPTDSVSPTNGVHFPEVAMYMGIAPLLIFSWSWWWIPILLSNLIVIGLLTSIQRIPARVLYLLTFSISCLSAQAVSSKSIFLLQALLLLKNASIYPSFPFSQWWDKPSQLYRRYHDTSQWPHFSGYLTESRNSKYEGDFRLRDEFLPA